MAHPKKGTLHQVLVPMVDATDFASIESGITESDFNSGVTKKFYGWNTGGSAAVTSGTISKAGSLVHSGVFRITLKTTENNYDMMMIRLNKTGTAEQIMTWSNVDNDDSDIMSMLTAISGLASDAHSAAAQVNSRVLLNQSRISDIQSYLVALSDQLSDAHSDIKSQLTAGVGINASDMSDLRSAIAAGPAATITTSDISNIASAVWAEKYRVHSAASSFGSLVSVVGTNAAAGSSRALLNQSRISDVQSYLVALSDQLSDAHSDIASKVGGITATVGASDISDIASAVWAHTVGTRVDSRILVGQSFLSDILSQAIVVASMASDAHSAATQANSRALVLQSYASDILSHVTALSDAISDFNSDIRSLMTVTGVQLNASSLSDLRSAIAAGPAGVLTASDISDIASNVWAHATGAATASRMLLTVSRVSDLQSYVSDMHSNLLSFISGAGPTVSDLASAVWSEKYTGWTAASTFGSAVRLNMSRISDIQSYLVANSGAISDIHSLVSAFRSDFDSQLSDFRSDLTSFMTTTGVGIDASTMSDLRSAIAAGPAATVTASDISDIASAVRAIIISDLSDILSAAQAGASRALLNQSRISDTYSMLSDFYSDFTSKIAAGVATRSQVSDLHSNLLSFIAAGVPIQASDMSDLRSAITGATFTLSASDISDITSSVRANLASDISDILSAAQAASSRALVTQSLTSDVYSLLSDFNSEFGSRVNKAVATASALTLAASVISDAHSAAAQTNSRALVNQSAISDVYSLLGAVGVGVSGISDIASAVWAYAGTEPTTVVSATATMGATLDWLRALSRNRITQTATVQSLRNDANNADIASCAVSDDATTAVRGEWSN